MKQISDKEKIEIMNHFINGGEIEYQHSVTDKWYDTVEPTWNWYACNYRKKEYNYPLYFEYIGERGDTFFVEFDSLDSGTVIRVDSGKYKVGHGSGIWYPHTDVSKWKQVNKPSLEIEIVYEIYRIDKNTGESEILTKLLTDNMLKILQEDSRTRYTYHKTGRSFEIKLGDK